MWAEQSPEAVQARLLLGWKARELTEPLCPTYFNKTFPDSVSHTHAVPSEGGRERGREGIVSLIRGQNLLWSCMYINPWQSTSSYMKTRGILTVMSNALTKL